ncbi:MAG: 6,7-dimethyl-8-ribityllumazine synthase [Candidatus Micrarchaeia archaeon]
MVRLGFVVSEFNYDITSLMLSRAKSHADFLGATVVCTFWVPGAFDAPLAVQSLLERDDIDAVVMLGAVIEGETEHDEVVMQHAARKAMDLSIQYKKPVSLGISGPGMSRLQGQERIDSYAKRSVEAAVKLVRRIKLAKASKEKEIA